MGLGGKSDEQIPKEKGMNPNILPPAIRIQALLKMTLCHVNANKPEYMYSNQSVTSPH